LLRSKRNFMRRGNEFAQFGIFALHSESNSFGS
jgi:hypothetical protein